MLPVHGHALHGWSVEQVRGVGQRGPDTVGGLAGVQAQVELRGAALPLQAFDLQQPGDWALPALRVSAW